VVKQMVIKTTLDSLRVNGMRFQQDFEALSQIGATEDGGVHRPSFSPAHLEARRWFKQRIQQAGLEFTQDGAGNLSASLACGPRDGLTLLLGSHLDSVPYGGRFDGALGVMAAFEVLRTVQEAGIALPFNLEAIDFTDEEGTLISLLGSLAVAGKLTRSDCQSPRGGREEFLAGLNRAGLNEESLLTARRDAGRLAGYFELHIEQGPRLSRAGVKIGVVSSIAGNGSIQLTFVGKADHAGTTPLSERLDAGRGASAFHQAVWTLIEKSFPDCFVNIGEMVYRPGAFNIVPAEAVLSLDYRASEPESFKNLETALLETAQTTAQGLGLEIKAELLGKHQPTPLHPKAQRSITRAVENLGLSRMSLSSGACHDGQSLAELCPVGMIFVPSIGGASHSPREMTEWADCVNGANVLLQTVLMFT
jgi:beta-ureidopropionase / N-carbamoyl-L-amino-acid hydrolase